MIDSIQLTNFQSHNDSLLVFHPGVNTIIGSSDSGKTAILRALNWAINNRPSGEGFVSNWIKDKKGKQKGETSVKILSDKGSLERKRTEDFNGYILEKQEAIMEGFGGETVLEAVKTDVPEQVTEFFNLSEVNIQKQMDAPFLLSNTSGEVARFFNKIIKLEDIDQALSLAEKKKRETKSKVETLQQTIETDTETLKKYSWVEEVEALYTRAEKLNDKLETARDLLAKLQMDLDSYRKVVDAQKKIPDVKKLEQLSQEAAVVCVAIEMQISTKLDLQNILDKFKTVEINLKSPKLKIIEAETSVSRAIRLLDSLEENWKTKKTLEYSLIRTGIIKNKMSEAAVELETLVSKLPDTCPVCGNPMKKDAV